MKKVQTFTLRRHWKHTVLSLWSLTTFPLCLLLMFKALSHLASTPVSSTERRRSRATEPSTGEEGAAHHQKQHLATMLIAKFFEGIWDFSFPSFSLMIKITKCKHPRHKMFEVKV